MKKRFTMVAACLLMGMSAAWAQNTKVTGHVVDENGEPVIGASRKRYHDWYGYRLRR